MRDEVSADVDQELRLEVAELIIDSLVMDDITVDDIDPEAPLFGEGLCLNSIDALEIAFAIAQKYGIKLRSDHERNDRIFASLNSLTQYIGEHRTK